jgi:2-amino-4-hydroxy-6-hydroxymethyldihydropteridine diphosphokinase
MSEATSTVSGLHWRPAYVALGSNLDDPAIQVERAFAALAGLPGTHLVLRSRAYRSPPLGPADQPDFVNAVAALLTVLEPHALLHELKSLEAALGRAAPSLRWGPRRIDLDLLMHGGARVADDRLTLPHPGIAERAFVLRPWAEIAPDVLVPGLGRVRRLLERVDATTVHPLPR